MVRILSSMLVIAILAPGCAVRADPRDEAIEERTDWTKLGERWVDYGRGRADRDVIQVGADEGRFTRIRLAVEHSAVELRGITVTFGDGTTFSPGIRGRYAKGSHSPAIDLPGGSRVIRNVEFRYRNLRGGGRAQLELWAK